MNEIQKIYITQSIKRAHYEIMKLGKKVAGKT